MHISHPLNLLRGSGRATNAGSQGYFNTGWLALKRPEHQPVRVQKIETHPVHLLKTAKEQC